MEKYCKSVKWWGIFILVLAAGILYGCRLPDSENAIMHESKETELIETQSRDVGNNNTKSEIYVYVSGCVKKPGVYCLPTDSRIYQAIEAAGGMTKKADTKSCNLAEALQDGIQVHIPSKKESGALQQNKSSLADNHILTDTFTDDESEKAKSTKININTASKEELMTLSGIGEVKAQAIITYRQSQGAFSQIRDLMKVEGIKEGSYKKIQDDICVE